MDCNVVWVTAFCSQNIFILCYESTLLVKAKILTKDTKRPAISGKSGSVLC